MYEAFYGLRERPFSLIPDPRFLYLSQSHRMALTLLEYGLANQTGFIVISGEVGSGKTTLLRQLLKSLGDDVTVGLITNTHPSFGELLKWILLAFDLKYEGKDRVGQHQIFVDFLVAQYAAARRTVLLLDEAQNLDADALEELRMLSNVNAGDDFLLQLVLVGQPELRATLKRPALRQFVQRISLYYHLEPLAIDETDAYIRHRLQVAGAGARIFDELACAAVHHYASGIPRLINTLCDHALVYGYAEDKRAIDIDTVLDVVRARQRTGLETFRSEPEGASREEMKAFIGRTLRSAAGDAADTPQAQG